MASRCNAVDPRNPDSTAQPPDGADPLRGKGRKNGMSSTHPADPYSRETEQNHGGDG